MNECIFCKIVKGEIPCAKVWEDKEYLAFLDIFPNTKGMTLVITKKHYDSYAFDIPKQAYIDLLLATKEVSKKLEKALKVKRVAMVMEGMGVDHVHIKLYPLHGLTEKFKETWAPETKFFEKYEGYIATVLGPKANQDDLNKLATQIRDA